MYAKRTLYLILAATVLLAVSLACGESTALSPSAVPTATRKPAPELTVPEQSSRNATRNYLGEDCITPEQFSLIVNTVTDFNFRFGPSSEFDLEWRKDTLYDIYSVNVNVNSQGCIYQAGTVMAIDYENGNYERAGEPVGWILGAFGPESLKNWVYDRILECAETDLDLEYTDSWGQSWMFYCEYDRGVDYFIIAGSTQ